MNKNQEETNEQEVSRQEPFEISCPCRECGGTGRENDRSCSSCSGTGAGKYFHGTKFLLRVGDIISPGFHPNFGDLSRSTNWVYFTGTLDAAIWGAELALGEGAGRIYVVEPTGPFEDDPNLTNKRFAGNPTRSYRSKSPLKILSLVVNWKGHSMEALSAMKAGLEEAKRLGIEPIDD